MNSCSGAAQLAEGESLSADSLRLSPILISVFTTRPATVADATLITAHRRAMFESMPNPQAPVLDTMCPAFEAWVRERLAAGRYFGWIIDDNGQPVASAGLMILDWPPHPLHPTSDKRAYLLNVYVEPACRKRGLARQLLERCIGEAQRLDIPVVTLHSSDAGRSVYEKFGFHPTSEMMRVER
jgi:GNAT superfamily N-acetyltransferase